MRNAVRSVAPLISHPLGDWRREPKLKPIRPTGPREQCLKLRRRGDLGERRRTLRHCHARAVQEVSSGAPPCHAQGVAGALSNSGYRHLPTKVGASARQPGPSKCLRPNSCARPTENTGGGSCQGSSRSASGLNTGSANGILKGALLTSTCQLHVALGPLGGVTTTSRALGVVATHVYMRNASGREI